MHWKSKQKIQGETTKLYITELKNDENKAHEIRLQLGKKEFVLIDLKDEFPKKIFYSNLANGGFNYNLGIDDRIIIYPKTRIIEILENSKNSKAINSKTVNQTINLINGMKNFIYT